MMATSPMPFTPFTAAQRADLREVLVPDQVAALEDAYRTYHATEAAAMAPSPAPTPISAAAEANLRRAVRDTFGDQASVTVTRADGPVRTGPAFTGCAPLRDQLEQAADAVDHAMRLVAALPPYDAVPAEVGYGQTVRRWQSLIGRRVSVDEWRQISSELAANLRSGAADIVVSKKDHAIRALNCAIGSAVFLSTNDLAPRDVRRVLKVLRDVNPCRSPESGLVGDVQDHTAGVLVGPGHPLSGGVPGRRVADVAPALVRQAGRIRRRGRDSAL